MANNNNNNQIIPPINQIAPLILTQTKTFAKKHKLITTSYLFGLFLLLTIGSGTKLSFDQRRQYNAIMETIDLNAEYDATLRYANAMNAYRASKGWFFSCDGTCRRNKERMEREKRVLDAIREEGYNRMSDAKSVAGLFSEVGVGEVKDSFWEYFDAGKKFAKRQTMWDAMFMGIRSMSRDESTVEYILKVLFQLLINFSMGLVVALAFFVLGLWSIVKSYQPDPLTAVLFFVSATCAAFAFVATFLFVLYGAAAGGLYGVAKIVESNARIQNGGGGGGRGQGGARRHVRDHPHYY